MNKNELYPLDTELLRLTEHDIFDVRSATSGTFICGSTGSGKSSGSGFALSQAFVANGFGGLVLCGKDDTKYWERLCASCQRSDDLIIISPSNHFRFNFLNYFVKHQERLHGKDSAGLSSNIVNLLMTLVEAARGSKTKTSDSYWQDALIQMLINCTDLCILSKGTVSINDLYQIVNSAPQSVQESACQDWQSNSLTWQLIEQGYAKQGEMNKEQERDFQISAEYFLKEFPRLAEKTRSIIISSFTSMANSFLRGKLHTLFCSDEQTNVIPELTYLSQKIVVVGLSSKKFGKLGTLANIMFKFCWQKAIETRDLQENSTPTFLWADEAQLNVSPYDREFQSTARSVNVCTVYLSQQIAGFIATLGGGEVGRAETMSLLSNLKTHIHHANMDYETQQYFANSIGL